MAQFEVDSYFYVRDIAQYEGISCDWESVPGVRPIYSQAVLDLVRQRIVQLQSARPDLAARVRLSTNPLTIRKFKLHGDVLAVLVQDLAASFSPYKLVVEVLRRLLDGKERLRCGGTELPGVFRSPLLEEFMGEHRGLKSRLNLQTNTPVLGTLRTDDRWIVWTHRGVVSCKHVILATNAYTSYLLPKFSEIITPVMGQATAFFPPLFMSGERPFPYACTWTEKQEGDSGESEDRLILMWPRDSKKRILIIGGERLVVPSDST